MKRSTQHEFEPEEIMAYLDGELEAQQASALASHLEHCSECGILAVRLRQISERMLDLQVESCPGKLEEPIIAALNSGERKRPAELKFGKEAKQRRILRVLAWAVGSIAAVLIIASISVPYLVRSRRVAEPAAEGATGMLSRLETYQPREGLTIPSKARSPAEPTPAAPLAGRGVNSVVTLARPGTAADSNGLSHGLGDHAADSFSVNGQPFADQQNKVFSKQIEAPELHGPMIVQTASITILASNYDQASAAIELVTAQHGGYVQDMTANTPTGSARSVSATLRVPDAQIEGFLADLRKLGHVEQETRNNQEITDQYIDLTARLKTARATERRIMELLGARTGKLSDVLEAERELARIRGEIESMDGQRANMEHQVRYATVQVQLNEEYREQLNPQAFSTGTRMRNSLVDGFRNLAGGVASLVIFVLAYGPSILFWLALLGLPLWFVWRRYRPAKAA